MTTALWIKIGLTAVIGTGFCALLARSKDDPEFEYGATICTGICVIAVIVSMIALVWKL